MASNVVFLVICKVWLFVFPAVVRGAMAFIPDFLHDSLLK